jgi:hypothetical protein
MHQTRLIRANKALSRNVGIIYHTAWIRRAAFMRRALEIREKFKG